MAGRVILFGATGFTGRLTAEALVARGARPILAARSADRLSQLADELGGGLETVTADVAEPKTVADIVERGDVLVTTVGPFVRFGSAAARAAVEKGAHYLDSTGEPPFIRDVFEHFGPAAERAGSGMLTAFGYDFVPGNLAGALALHEAGEDAVRVDTGYFFTGPSSGGEMSGGTRASLAGVIAEPAFAWRDGRVVTERGARRLRTFDVEGEQRPAVSVGTSCHFGLPRVAPQLREVNAYLGWFGPLSRVVQISAAGGSLAMKVPGMRRLTAAATGRFVKGSTGGPDAQARAKTGSHFVAIAYDGSGAPLSEVHLAGLNGYDYTARLLAWGAVQASEGGLRGAGALGPVDGFGLESLQSGSNESGVARVS